MRDSLITEAEFTLEFVTRAETEPAPINIAPHPTTFTDLSDYLSTDERKAEAHANRIRAARRRPRSNEPREMPAAWRYWR